jgi:hypothetical protein
MDDFVFKVELVAEVRARVLRSKCGGDAGRANTREPSRHRADLG